MKYVTRLAVFFAAVVLLASCGQRGPQEPVFSASVGTYQAPSGTGMSYLFLFHFEDEEAVQSADINVQGPDGWNNGQPFVRTLDRVWDEYWTWSMRTESSAVAMSGEYTVTATIDGSTYTKDVTVDAADVLEQTTVTVDSATQSQVTASWSSVPGAESYRLYLSTDDESAPAVSELVYTTDTSATISDLNLVTGADYYVGVLAFNTDFTVNSVPLPDGQFKSSWNFAHFSVEP